MAVTGFIVLFGGLFSIFCAWRDYDWFMDNPRARLFVKLLGRGGARVFYIALGAALFCAGVAMVCGRF